MTEKRVENVGSPILANRTPEVKEAVDRLVDEFVALGQQVVDARNQMGRRLFDLMRVLVGERREALAHLPEPKRTAQAFRDVLTGLAHDVRHSEDELLKIMATAIPHCSDAERRWAMALLE